LELHAGPVLARGLLHHALAYELDLGRVRIEARSVGGLPSRAVHLVGNARVAAALARDAGRDAAGVERAALQPCEVGLERDDMLADLAFLHLHALYPRERLAAALADQLDDGAQRFRVGERRGLLAGSAQARQEFRHHLRRLGLAVELGLPVLQGLD